ncbi:hypothetical protein L1887_25415 [Cichorium endivia]|nr:hypothetical protein L1887_25415 [Cichorium endivia]
MLSVSTCHEEQEAEVMNKVHLDKAGEISKEFMYIHETIEHVKLAAMEAKQDLEEARVTGGSDEMVVALRKLMAESENAKMESETMKVEAEELKKEAAVMCVCVCFHEEQNPDGRS